MDRVCIIGAGKIGTAIGRRLLTRAEARFWDNDPERAEQGVSLESAVSGAKTIFLCVPSWSLRAAASSIAPYASETAVLVSISKGLEEDTGLPADRVVGQALGESRPFVFLGGAMLAAEVASDLGGAAVAASRSPQAAKAIASLLRGGSMRVDESRDVAGAVYGGVCKNVYALCLGMADGLGWGSNAKGWLAAMTIREMERVVAALGGERGTVFGPAGVGDLLATGFSLHSHHRRMGQELASVGVMSARSEGAGSVPHLVTLLGGTSHDYPLLNMVHRSLGGESPRKLMDELYETIP